MDGFTSEVNEHWGNTSLTSTGRVISPTSKALGRNPKDIIGAKKPSLTKIPAIAELWESLAMMDGAGKYNPYNWRANEVYASVYIDALIRHAKAWFEGERCASDSGCHHLGHARACLGILLDAEATGNLIDDRPVTEESRGKYSKVMEEINELIPRMQERHKQFHEERKKKDSEAKD
jgi:hypothetical protein